MIRFMASKQTISPVDRVTCTSIPSQPIGGGEPEQPQLLTLSLVASILRISPQSVLILISEKKLRRSGRNDQVLISVPDLNSYIAGVYGYPVDVAAQLDETGHPKNPLFLTIAEVAQHFAVAVPIIRRLIANKTIRRCAHVGQVRIPVWELDRVAKNHTVPAVASA